jgi:hypothetical protein
MCKNDVILHKRHFAAKLTRRVTNTYYKTPLVICKIDMKENICPCIITTFFKTKPSSISKLTSLDGTSSRRTTCNETCKNIAKRNKILKCLDWLYFLIMIIFYCFHSQRPLSPPTLWGLES